MDTMAKEGAYRSLFCVLLCSLGIASMDGRLADIRPPYISA